MIASSKPVIVNDMSELKGKLLRDGAVEILAEPYFDRTLQAWCALANAWGCLAIVELSVQACPATAKQHVTDATVFEKVRT